MIDELNTIDECLKKIRGEMIGNRIKGIMEDGAGTDWPPIVIGHVTVFMLLQHK